MPDIRVDTGFFRHNKTKRLKRSLGLDGVIALQMLWAYAADNKHGPEKVYTADDIELAVDWDGEPGSLVVVLSGEHCRFLDVVDGGYSIHEWAEHNGYAATAKAREERGKAGANARWNAKRGNGKCKDENEHMLNDATIIEQAFPDSGLSNAPSPSPSPSPSPLEKEKDSVTALRAKRFTPPTLEEVTEYCRSRGSNVDPQRWIDHYTSNGWKVGKNPMKDWRAAVRTWDGSGVSPPAKTGGQGIHSGFSEKDYGAGGLI